MGNDQSSDTSKTGSKRCSTCNGTGRVTYTKKESTCSACSGSGKKQVRRGDGDSGYWENDTSDCLSCNGKGYHETTSSRKCPDCN